MYLKQFALLAVCVACILGVSPVNAANEEVRIAVVDLERALADSKPGAEAQKKYEAEVKGAQKELDSLKAEYEKLNESFTKQAKSLNIKAGREKADELEKLKKDLQRKYEDSQAELRKLNTQIISDLLKELRGVVKEVGDEEGYTFIFEKGSQAVLYADKSADITDKVIKRFDSK